MDILKVAAAVTGMIACITAVGGGIAYGWSVLRKVSRFIDDLIGRPPRPGERDGRPGALDQLAELRDHVLGTPSRPGEQARPGIIEQLTELRAELTAIRAELAPIPAMRRHLEALDERVGAIEAEMRPNGGSSLRDALTRVEASVSGSPAQQAA